MNSRYAYDIFVIRHQEDWRFSAEVNDWGVTPNGLPFILGQFPVPRDGWRYAVGPYHGNDNRRIWIPLAIESLRRAYRRMEDRFRRRCRLRVARARLVAEYERSKLIFDQRISKYGRRMEETQRRINYLEDYICPGLNLPPMNYSTDEQDEFEP